LKPDRRFVLAIALLVICALPLPAEISLRLDREFAEPGQSISGVLEGLKEGEEATLEWEDAFGTTLARAPLTGEGGRGLRFRFSLTNPTTLANFIVARTDKEEKSVTFRIFSKVDFWSDYVTVVEFSEKPSAEVLGRLRKAGFRLALSRSLSEAKNLTAGDFYVLSSNLIPREELYKSPANWQKALRAYGSSRIKGVLAGLPYFAARGTVEGWVNSARRRLENEELFHPIGFAIFDDFSIVPDAENYDLSFSPEALRRFRIYLQGLYGSIEDLNQGWQTEYSGWNEVVAPSLDEVVERERRRANGSFNFSSWVDFRLFMQMEFARTLSALIDGVRGGRKIPFGFLGGKYPTPFCGYDWPALLGAAEFIEAADILDNRDRLRSYNDPSRTAIFSRIERSDAVGEHTLWRNFLRGDRGCIVSSRALISFEDKKEPALTPVATALGQIDQGLGALWSRLEAVSDPVAIYDSAPSEFTHFALDCVARGSLPAERPLRWYLTTSTTVANRLAWLSLLEDAGIHPDFVSLQQLKKRDFLRKYRLLILPKCIALSDEELALFESFVKAGGTLVVDSWAGLFDEHGKLRKSPPFEDFLGFRRRQKKAPRITELAQTYRAPREATAEATFPVRRGEFALLSEKGAPSNWQLLESGLQAGRARPLLDVNGNGAVFVRKVRQGRTFYLNLSLLGFISERRNSLLLHNLAVLRDLILETAGVRPRVRIFGTSGSLSGWEAFVWQERANPKIRYIGIIPRRKTSVPAALSKEPESVLSENVEIRLDLGGFLYDMRRGRYLGSGRSLRLDRLDLREPLFIAVLPYRVRGIDFSLGRSGMEVNYRIEILTEGRMPVEGTHIVRLDFEDPTGKSWPHYSMKVLLYRGLASGSLKMPGAIPAGDWTVRASDISTGYRQSAPLAVP